VQGPQAFSQWMPSHQVTKLTCQESEVVGLRTGFEPCIRTGF
jgi:hypothetical protein